MSTILTTSGVSARTGKGFVVVHWIDQSGQLTPDEARDFALRIIQAADAAEFDAAFVKTLGGLDTKTLTMLAAVREGREGRAYSGRAQTELGEME